MLALIELALLVCAATALPQQPKASTCGYDSCPKADPTKLNVHIVPHSHDDVGWLKTVDQYYYGSRTDIQRAGVQYILDSVIDALASHPERKFVYAETAFFWKWWVEQTPEQQDLVSRLVNNGQLEFIGGAWTQNDEATTLYHTTIDQFTWGLRRLNDTFGYCGQPKVGWQIDPFGHSKELASLMAQFNFDGVFFGRIDYQDKNNRLEKKTLEMIWEADQNLGEVPVLRRPGLDLEIVKSCMSLPNFCKYYTTALSSLSDVADLFTGALYDGYGPPAGYCFDINCGEDAIIDNPDVPDYNLDQRVVDFANKLNEQRSHVETNNIILMMGTDFTYMYAGMYFKNMDKLMKGVNAAYPEINVFYSTPSCYLKSQSEANITWTTKQDDFFPYASASNSYWTGYFTSRPGLKRFERQAHAVLQVGKQLSAISNLDAADSEKLNIHREAQGILQHHDAITGTEKQHVADDYARLLHIGVTATEEVIAKALNSFIPIDTPALDIIACPLINISQCAVTERSDAFLVILYNALSQKAHRFVRFPVADEGYTVLDPEGNEPLNQVVPISEQVANIPGREAVSRYELVFDAQDIPPFGYKVYYVSKNESARFYQKSTAWKPTPGEDFTVGSTKGFLTFDGKTNLLKSFETERATYDLVHTLEYYVGALGDNNGEENRSSGAYVFRPNVTESSPISEVVNVTIYNGTFFTEVHQQYADWATLVTRHYVTDGILELDWTIGPIPIDDVNGKEIISKFRTNLNNEGLFTTDTNGRNDIVRRRDHRPTWDLNLKEPIAGNYYPVTLNIYIDNGTDRLAVVSDRAQGGSSLKDGELEIMLHRRLLHDDAFGAGEALNEMAYGEGLVARGVHLLLMGPTSPRSSYGSTYTIRSRENQSIMDSLVFVANVTGRTFADVQREMNLSFSGLTAALPPQIQILTLEPWKENTLLLRLEHMFTPDQYPDAVTVDLSNAFSTFEIISARETTLAANQWLDEATRLQWFKEGSGNLTPKQRHLKPLVLEAIELAPKQIRTFVLNVQPKINHEI